MLEEPIYIYISWFPQKALTKFYKSIFEEKQQFIQFTIAMFENYYYILKFMLSML